VMRGAVLYGPRDVRFEERAAPTIVEPTDAVIRLSATCICGSDLWPYRGISATNGPTADGARVLRHRRRRRPRSQVDHAGTVRHRIVLRVRQRLSSLPGRVSVVLPAPRARHRGAGAADACP